ncbi:hypothetical protein HH1059_03700 [Halorhodospira halochloris]|uniref:Uncharacterized protein n=1 Tax=Halorhodospira halochloris TaxID=1052 RepID=A0A2Z6EZB3_HALHR|nr:hypothetical protein HH1059_03700 [Halorhodospira halochloris]
MARGVELVPTSGRATVALTRSIPTGWQKHPMSQQTPDYDQDFKNLIVDYAR